LKGAFYQPFTSTEANLAQNVDSFHNSDHLGYEKNAFEGMRLVLDVAAEKKIKLIVNGGALNPEGMARDIHKIVCTSACSICIEADRADSGTGT
jgi:hypothetical protein